MANVDVVKTIKESFYLIQQHYQEVALPLIILVILATGGNLGSSLFSDGDSGSGLSDRKGGSLAAGSLIANAMSSNELLALGGLFVGVIVLVLLFFFAIMILNQALYLYVYEHFYAIMRKMKITESWKQRMKRLSVKAFFLEIFWLLLFIAIFALPFLQLLNSIGMLKEAGRSEVISALYLTFLLILLAVLVSITVSFFLSPLWVFYAMDGMGFFESISRSVGMVASNLMTFLLFAVIFAALQIAGFIVSVVSCCFSYIVSPIIFVFLALLYGVSLMNIKLQIEGAGAKAG
ncbi:MAG: hypothetical protein N3G22_03195 [Candidatus Micrarchaeota archaeon]|nr:hypothetical protein [Candidatus Micrarchaeota archaeon]